MVTAQTILGLVPCAAFLLCTFALEPLCSKLGVGAGLRERLVVAALVCGAWTVLGTELLSLATALSFLPILVWWCALIAAAGAFLLRTRKAGQAVEGEGPAGCRLARPSG
jgi:hypothetical protein